MTTYIAYAIACAFPLMLIAVFICDGSKTNNPTFYSGNYSQDLTNSITIKSGNPAKQKTGRKMTDQEIIDMFDSTNITLARLALISGRTVPQLKKLLMGA